MEGYKPQKTDSIRYQSGLFRGLYWLGESPQVSLDVHELLDPDQDINDSQPEHTALEEIVGDQGPQLGIEVEDVVILPDPEPWEAEQKNADKEKIHEVESALKPEKNPRGSSSAVCRIQVYRLERKPGEHAVQNHPLDPADV
jgi:hypothetical protein